MVSKHKTLIMESFQREMTRILLPHWVDANQTQPASIPSTPGPSAANPSHCIGICHATKCQLLHAKGIIWRPMYCVAGKNMCTRYKNETVQQRKTQQPEQDILSHSATNASLAPLLDWLHTPTSLKSIRWCLSHLPMFQCNGWDGHIFGATRYLANTLGLLTSEQTMGEMIDIPMTPQQKETGMASCHSPRQMCYTKHPIPHLWPLHLLP